MDLADSGLGDSQNVPDLFHVEIFVVVERYDEALLLRERADRVGDDVLRLSPDSFTTCLNDVRGDGVKEGRSCSYSG